MNDFDRQRDEQHLDPDANEPWQIVKQTEGLDADETRRVAGPDWEPGVSGDVEAEDKGTAAEGQGMSEPNAGTTPPDARTSGS